MYNVDKQLQEKLREFNNLAKNHYGNLLNLDREFLKTFIEKQVGSIVRSRKLKLEELEVIERKGGIIGVDGSVNRKGGASPHYIEVFKALAKSSKKSNEDLSLTEIYSPILYKEDLDNEELEEDRRDEILASLEVKVAMEAAKKYQPYAIMMDGSFIRYIINCQDEWDELRNICESKGIFLIGIIEDIKTDIIGRELYRSGQTDIIAHDRELLFGNLDYGDMVLIKDRASKKSKGGELSSLFMRSSMSPNIIGMDIIDLQRKNIEEMGNLIFSLTPENSRGVPLWMDLVDKEVKISNRMIEGMIKSHLDRDIYERFFVEVRSKRR